MSLRDTINSLGGGICEGFAADGVCAFAPPERTEGFIDTSVGLDRSRGIAFLCDMITANPNGRTVQLPYDRIESVTVIPSFEGDFEDELSVRGGETELRIIDCSLNKARLKELIDLLCQEYCRMSAQERESETAQCALFESQRHTQKLYFENISIEKPKLVIPETHRPADVTEEKINWISESLLSAPQPVPQPVSQPVSQPVPQPIPQPAPTREQPVPQPVPQPAPQPVPEDEAHFFENPVIPEIRDAYVDITAYDEVAGLSTEETLSLVRSSIDEINAPPAPTSGNGGEGAEHGGVPAEGDSYIHPEPLPSKPRLTVEPDSDDLYLIASRRLRELCEDGSITMEQMTTAVKDSLDPAADVFTRITDELGVPPELNRRVTELLSGSERLSGYFAMGQDIPVRVMFFMLYQILSYSDRIAQTPETKERLNDFFKRWGPTGITLSMLEREAE